MIFLAQAARHFNGNCYNDWTGVHRMSTSFMITNFVSAVRLILGVVATLDAFNSHPCAHR
jgi:hypothetical protein